MNWFQRVRLRVFAVVVAGVLAVIGVLSWATLPAWPVVGVAIITVAAVVNQMTNRLSQPVCYRCGSDLNAGEAGVYGVVCGGCGAVNESVPGAARGGARLARGPEGLPDGASGEGEPGGADSSRVA